MTLEIILAVAKPDPVKVGFVFAGAACTGLFWGAKILLIGFAGWRKAEYPLTKEKMLTGTSARLVAMLIMSFGLLTFGCGVATAIFGVYRMRQLL